MIECNRLCKQFLREDTCKMCQNEYIVSDTFYTGKRPMGDYTVIGYLVRSKRTGNIIGILNKNTYFKELAWVETNSVKEVDNV